MSKFFSDDYLAQQKRAKYWKLEYLLASMADDLGITKHDLIMKYPVQDIIMCQIVILRQIIKHEGKSKLKIIK